MASARRGEGRRRRSRRGWLPLLGLALAAAWQSTAVGLADEPTVEPAETSSGFAWKPASAITTPGGAVAFRNPGAVTPHGVHWTGGPEKPSCSGVPVDSFGTSWSGACTFAQAGTYTFVCTVHPEEMKGTITVAAGETPPPTGAGPGPAPAESPLVEALRLAKNQHGMAVRGSIVVSSAAAGGSLSVELEAKRASLGKKRAGSIQVGKLTRALASPGLVRFAVPLKAFAQRVLRQRGRLPLTVKTAIAPPSGIATTLTRRIELHG
ncbi:MAG TPA: plastocyanin/azurin family copper-binding protein [Solirubrobacterales bacterium]|nr:plastocyanin/azurin family copper-binding protein [Solirubrobacterales bacterium]